MSASSGCPVLDDALSGGFPLGRTVLVTGGPGTGKSTLGMQFLQAGLEAGEECLFVSTEQTPEELSDSFSGFAFDLDDERLTLTSLHATSGYTLEDEDRVLTLQTLTGEESLGDGYSARFEPQHVVEFLSRQGPVDRVVLDSVSGLSAMGEDHDRFRRALFDIVRLFNDEFEATALVTAEETGAVGDDGVRTVATEDAVQFNTHGVVRVWRENVEGEFHRYLEVVKMRGVDHDTRVYEVDFGGAGLSAYPRNRTHPGEFVPDDHLETGIGGFDALLGGGVCRGGSLLLEHDGRASPHSMLTNVMQAAYEDGMAMLVVPPVELPPKRLREIVATRMEPMDDLFADDRLFLLDFTNVWENSRPNVFKPAEGTDPVEAFETVADRRGDRAMLNVINVEAQLPFFENDQLRRLRFWEEENFFREDDTSVYLFNPEALDAQVAAFYRNAAWQVVKTWLADSGLQYLKLEKSPSGYLGSTRLVEYADEDPYMRVQGPPSGQGGDGSRGGGR